MNETQLIEDLRLLSPPGYGWALGLVAVAIGGAALGLVLWRRRRRVSVLLAAPESRSSPWDLALADLERLSPLWRTDRSRDYGIAVTAILRRYIEARFGFHAPRLTTEEFLTEARSSPALPEEDRVKLARFLERCDLCKFGRFLAAVEELQELQAAAVAFVLRSRPKTQTAPEEGIPGMKP